MNKIPYFITILAIFISACSKKYTRFIPNNYPAPIYMPDRVEMGQIGPPPIIITENEDRCKNSIGSQYYKVAIPPCMDMTLGAEHIKNSLADLFYTALFETKRFSLIDRMEIQKTEEVNQNRITEDTLLVDQQGLNKLASANNSGFEQSRKIIDDFKSMCDGFLEIKITSDVKNAKTESGKVGIDYRIVRYDKLLSSEPIVLLAGSKEISYSYNKTIESLAFNRQDISDVANEITAKFPNPDMRDDQKVINRRGNIITVNTGKSENIVSGMLGFIIKVNKDINNNKSVCYRAEFEVTEVFQDSFNALLFNNDPEDTFIISTIRIGEPIKMK